MPLPPVYPDVWLRQPVQLWSLDKVSGGLPESVSVCMCVCVCSVCVSVAVLVQCSWQAQLYC